MQKFSDSSRMKSQKLMKTSLKRNVKKISIGAVLLAVGFSSYAVIASDDSMVSSKGKGVSIAAAGNTLYADNTADYGEATSSVALADGTLSDVNKTGSVALSSKKTVKKTKATLSSKKFKGKKKLYVRVKAVGAKKWSKVVKIKVKK